jgi:uncharacterized protein
MRSSQLVRVSNGRAVVYNSVLSSPLILDKATLAFIDCFERPTLLNEILDLAPDSAWLVAELIDRGLLVDHEYDGIGDYVGRVKDNSSGSNLTPHNMTLIVSSNCNFGCTYCYQRYARPLGIWGGQLGGVLRAPRNELASAMSVTVALEAIDGFCAAAERSGRRSVAVGFSGGEPLLNWKAIQSVLDYSSPRVGRRLDISWGLNTNASLVTPSIAAALAAHAVLVDSSLDGRAVTNDFNRRTVGGRDTWQSIAKGLRLLRDYGVPVLGVTFTITPETLSQLDGAALRALVDLGLSNVAIEPDMTVEFTGRMDELADRILEVRSQGPSLGIQVSGTWERPFRTLLATGAGHPLPTHFCGGVSGEGFFVQPTGEVVACVGEFPEPLTVFDVDWAERLVEEFSDIRASRSIGAVEHCRGCEIEGACLGGCCIVDEIARRCAQPRLLSQRCELLRTITRRLLTEYVGSQTAS